MTKMMNSGIQRRYLKYTIALLVLALFLSSIGVWAYMTKNQRGIIVDKYEFLSEKMGITLENLYQKSDEVTAECILYADVQKSLQAHGLEDVQKNGLSKYFAYIDMEDVEEYCYVDNHQNIYTRSYSKVSYEEFADSGFARMLGEDYSTTRWFWTEDTLFGTKEPALFIGRYVRNMEYAHEPGMLFFKMKDEFLGRILKSGMNVTNEVAVGILDAEGRVCSLVMSEDCHIPQERIAEAVAKQDGDGMILGGTEVQGGVVSAYRQGDAGMVVFTYVPESVLNQGLTRLLLVLGGIYLMVVAVAVNLSIYFSKRFTKPIQDITEAMTGFDGNDFERTIELHTNTELDQIGHSYNEMLGNIERLLQEIKDQEKELRTSELNMLISQINPHFLYNTLDTIYMLARINKEETTMKMIQALSKYLRLSLNKGNDVVTVEDELENVKSYMEIQQIRNENLFQYEIDCRVDAARTRVLKLILQPLVENAIKYGFCDIFEGGVIRIIVEERERYLQFRVYNSGMPIETEMCEKLNGLSVQPLAKMKELFPDSRHGYGVVNIITRLRLKYGEGVRFYYVAEEDGTNCIVEIPKDGEDDHEMEADIL